MGERAIIYHFLLEPWDPAELVHTVRRGVEVPRRFGVHIIASEETFGQVRDEVQSREPGRPELEGFAERSMLYEVVA
jgi:hypothetical protein